MGFLTFGLLQLPQAGGMPKDAHSNDAKVVFYQSNELQPYISYLSSHAQPPIAYMLQLFDTHNLVVLAERTHSETTQWEFIYELTSHPAFIAKVGHVFTEYGSVTQQQALDDILCTPSLAEPALNQKLIELLRNFPLWPYGWHNNNIFDYLRKLYHLNRTLPADNRIALHFSDVPWQWDEKTSLDYTRYWSTDIPRRDRIMADHIIDRFREILQSNGPRKKALVILNTRHAFKTGGNNTGDFLYQAYPTQTANVMLNMTAYDFSGVSGEYQATYNRPIHDGLWDAAFWKLGNSPLGFNLKGSPFGKDLFDLHTYFALSGKVKYEHVFTGMVFYRPLGDHMVASAIAGYYDEPFKHKVLRRAQLMPKDDGARIVRFIHGLTETSGLPPARKEYWIGRSDQQPWCRLEFEVEAAAPAAAPRNGQRPAAKEIPMAHGDVTTAERLPSGDDIIERCVKKTGGREMLARINNRVIRGTVEIKPAGLKAILTAYQARPNRCYVQLDVAGQMTLSQGTDGEVVWEVNPITGPRIMKEQEKAILLLQYAFDETGYQERYDSVQCLGVELVDGQQAYKVLQSGKGAMPITVYYSKNTGLAMKSRYATCDAAGAPEVETTLSNYRTIDGVVYPHRTVQKADNVETLTLVESIKHNVVLDEKRFDLPEVIRTIIEKEAPR
jgi:hypothetical protein